VTLKRWTAMLISNLKFTNLSKAKKVLDETTDSGLRRQNQSSPNFAATARDCRRLKLNYPGGEGDRRK